MEFRDDYLVTYADSEIPFLRELAAAMGGRETQCYQPAGETRIGVALRLRPRCGHWALTETMWGWMCVSCQCIAGTPSAAELPIPH